MGLLGEIYSFGNRTRNKLRGLLDDPKGYLQQTADQTANTLRDMTGANETAQQFALRDKINAGDKNALAQYRNLEKTIQNKLFDVALNFNPAAVGMTAWHGSPHKFDKFDLAKIGTGEGAQAYGHGAYLAEAKDVANEYATKLSNVDSSGYANAQLNAHNLVQRFNGDKEWAKEVVKDQLANVEKADPNFKRLTDTLSVLEGKAPQQLGSTGNLYKTDIPDEAVARFLDWDKPLSQQAPEVQAALAKSPVKYGVLQGNKPVGDAFYGPLSGGTIYKDMTRLIDDGPNISRGSTNLTGQDAMVSQHLAELGIPGIRYLDSGSRAAGQGSSNFVIFDPNMIRILERNGQATGAQPWKPGEWGGLLK